MRRLSFIIYHLAFSAALLTLLTSCLNDKEPYQAGFYFAKPQYANNAFFANNRIDSITMLSYGNWDVTREASGSWLNIGLTSGRGNTIYNFPVTFEQNTTGHGRGTYITFKDTDHPGEASASIVYWQYATRGNGTLGSAPDVKAITGSDGSRFELTYDAQHRPLSLRITKNDGAESDAVLQNLTLTYNDWDSLLTVQDKSKTLTSRYANDYLPECLIGSGDTIGYSSQHYDNGMPVSANYAFRLEHRTVLGLNSYYAFLLGGQSLNPDSLHCADSLRIASLTGIGTHIDKYKLTYSTADNRCQSVDVNQLVFGAEQCDPYQLLSLFRYARNSSIVSSVEQFGERYEVAVNLNADKSVAKMTVIRIRKMVGADVPEDAYSVTYTFEY